LVGLDAKQQRLLVGVRCQTEKCGQSVAHAHASDVEATWESWTTETERSAVKVQRWQPSTSEWHSTEPRVTCDCEDRSSVVEEVRFTLAVPDALAVCSSAAAVASSGRSPSDGVHHCSLVMGALNLQHSKKQHRTACAVLARLGNPDKHFGEEAAEMTALQAGCAVWRRGLAERDQGTLTESASLRASLFASLHTCHPSTWWSDSRQ
jgi:hypothetical protein